MIFNSVCLKDGKKMKKYLLLEMIIVSFLFLNNDLMAQTLIVNPSLQIVQDESGQTIFIVTSYINWTVSDDATWLTVSPTSGFGNDTLIVTFERNRSRNSRNGTIEVTGGGITRTVTITQVKKDAKLNLTLKQKNRAVGDTAGSTTFDVTSNVTWMVNDNAEWLTVIPEFATNNDVLTATYTENTTTSQRVGTITVTGGGITRTVTVTQAAGSAILTVTPSTRSVTNASGSTTFTVESNTNWTVNDDAEWLTVSPTSGNNSKTLTATFTENIATNQRVGTITVTGGGITRTVIVIQSAGSEILTVTPSNKSVTNASGSTTFTVESNTNWSVNDDATWLTVSPASGNNNETLIATYTENTTTSQRVGTITVISGGIMRTVTVTQSAGSAILTVTPSNKSVTNASGSTTFTVESNTNWTISDDAIWLTVSPASGNNNRTLTTSYTENTTTSQRVGKITVTGGGITTTVTVTQLAGSAILRVIPSNRSVTNASGSTTFIVESNTNWTVSDDAEWLTVSPASGNNSETLTASYTENTTTSQRAGTITVTGAGITITVTVIQSVGSEIITVTPSNRSVTNASGSTTFIVESNTNWTVSDDAEWLTVIPEFGINKDTLIATYTENTTKSQRVGTITVTGGGITSSPTRSVTVIQSAGSEILTVTPSNQSVTNASGSTTFSVESNTNWTVSDDAEWLTVIPEFGINNYTLTTTYTENTTISQRMGRITITGGEITRIVTVTQSAGSAILTITPSARSVTNASGSTTFTMESNTNWTVNDDAEWLTVSPTSGNNNDTLTTTYTENTTKNQRVGTITVTGGGITSSPTRTVIVIQSAGSEILTVTPSNKSVTNASGSTTFTVESNTNWTVNDDAEWLTVSPISGNNNETLTATYTGNTTISQRVGTITVTSGGITRTVIVIQSAGSAILTVTPSNKSVTNASGSTTFTVESNTNWTVNDDAEWLTVSPINENNSDTLTATYTGNTTISQRVGTITVTSGGIMRTVTVTQSAGSAILTVTPSNQSVTNASGSTAFIVESNTNWTVSDDAAWLTVSPTSGNNNDTLTTTYTEDTTTSQRVGKITVTGAGITRTVTVTQSGSPITLIHHYSFDDIDKISNYQMIGLPGANNVLISSIMIGLPGKEGDWRAFWDSGNLPLTEYNGNDEFYFKPGRAFWIISRYIININLSVFPVSLSVDSTFLVQIHPGWNLISNPFDKVLTWNSVNNVNGGNLQPIYSYQNGYYINTPIFEPYKGYYFFCNDSLTSLKIPYYSENVLPKKNYINSKELEIALTLNGVSRFEISAGIAEDAKSGVDLLDIFSPPSLFCDVNMSLFSDEIETEYKYLQKEFRPEIGEGQSFNILIKNISNETLELVTKGLGNFSEYELYLLDKSLAKLYDLRKQKNIEIPKNTSGKGYVLYIGTEEYISQKKVNLIPLEYVLFQNYPNPFNPSTTIKYSIPKQANVMLKIYDLLGEEIETLVNEEKSAGNYEVQFDGSGFSSGVYFYQMLSGEFTDTKKFVLLK